MFSMQRRNDIDTNKSREKRLKIEKIEAIILISVVYNLHAVFHKYF